MESEGEETDYYRNDNDDDLLDEEVEEEEEVESLPRKKNKYKALNESDIDDDDDDYGAMDDDREAHRPKQNSYKILNESDINERKEEAITSIASVLSLSKAASSLLLRYYDWNVNSANDAWFGDEDKVREAVGLLPSSGPLVPKEPRAAVRCRICLEESPSIKMNSAGCGHLFCGECWRSYIRISIGDGPGCLLLKCPDPACRVSIDEDMIAAFAESEEEREKYSYYLRRSYVEASKDTKWCPAPGCEYALSYDGDNENYDVRCLCEYAFCWNCTEETHRPVGCKTVSEWILKNSSEAENTNWILANSKPCPKCHRPIEKNDGCMHMKCREPCRFHFCWLCLGPWKEHSSSTGGYYACNRHQKAKDEGTLDEAENTRLMAKHSLEKYTHYFERWQSNHQSRQKALEDLHQMETVNMEVVRLKQGTSVNSSEFSFLLVAWQQIIECRRVLKWTYAYGYYIPDNETVKKKFFEFVQGEAEMALEKLHGCAEKELQPFLDEDTPTRDNLSEEFIHFKQKLAGLTAMANNYFENLVRALENNLSEVM